MVQLSAAKYIGAMLQRVLATLSQRLPSQCLICCAWPAQVFCADCVRLFTTARLRCRRCAQPLFDADSICKTCRNTDWPLDQTLAALRYGYPWARLIREFKFQQATGWARGLAGLMLANPAIAAQLHSADWLLPMPLSGERLKSRGFNQALLLANALGRPKVRNDILLRTRDTPAQSAQSRAQRWLNVKEAYGVSHAHRPERSARLLLIDDVMTTGASLCEAARTLREAGASHVSALVLARAE